MRPNNNDSIETIFWLDFGKRPRKTWLKPKRYESLHVMFFIDSLFFMTAFYHLLMNLMNPFLHHIMYLPISVHSSLFHSAPPTGRLLLVVESNCLSILLPMNPSPNCMMYLSVPIHSSLFHPIIL